MKKGLENGKKKAKKMAKKQKGLPLTWSFAEVRVPKEKK